MMKKLLKRLPAKLTETYNQLIRRELVVATFVSFIVIATGVTLGYENNKIMPSYPNPTLHYNVKPHNGLSFLANWDGVNYLNIANHGYASANETNFFPLYPILVRVVNVVVGSELVSGLIVSWVSLVGAVYFYLKIIKRLFRTKTSREAMNGVYFFLLFPPAVVLIATYSTSLLASLSLGAIYFALQKRYIPASLFLMLDTATHIKGSFVLVLVTLILIEEHEKIKNIAISFLVGSLGLISYMSYLFIKYNNPLWFIKAQEQHGWLQTDYFHRLAISFSFIDVLPITLILLSIIYWWDKRKSFSIYSFFFLLIPVVGGQFAGFPRYAIMAFPFQMMLYAWFRNKPFGYTLVIAVFAITWGYWMLQYAGGYIGT